MMVTPEAPAEKPKSKETERKFLVAIMPDLTSSEGVHLDQGYIAIEEDGSEVRVRTDGVHHVLTVKSKGLLTRDEGNVPLGTGQFRELWPYTEGRRLAKMRHEIPLGATALATEVAELDIYEEDLDNLVTVEVEFPDKETANAFQPPEWFGEEVTEDKRYKNQQLAQHGIPEGYVPPILAA